MHSGSSSNSATGATLVGAATLTVMASGTVEQMDDNSNTKTSGGQSSSNSIAGSSKATSNNGSMSLIPVTLKEDRLPARNPSAAGKSSYELIKLLRIQRTVGLQRISEARVAVSE